MGGGIGYAQPTPVPRPAPWLPPGTSQTPFGAMRLSPYMPSPWSYATPMISQWARPSMGQFTTMLPMQQAPLTPWDYGNLVTTYFAPRPQAPPTVSQLGPPAPPAPTATGSTGQPASGATNTAVYGAGEATVGGGDMGPGAEAAAGTGGLGGFGGVAGDIGGYGSSDTGGGGAGGDSAGSEGGNCFIAGTKILLPDGTEMPIEDIEAGMRVVALNGQTKRLEKGTVVETFRAFLDEKADESLIRISTGHGPTITCTPRHRFLLEDWTWRRAGELQVGDRLFSMETIEEVERLPPAGCLVYNLRVEPQHTYLANGQVVHNDKAKKGAVLRTKRQRRMRMTWGEPGTAPGGRSGETAIFVPDVMRRPGLQGKERQVRQALIQALRGISADSQR